ncbi:MAG: PDZ domain-containing protein [bacterium]
MSDLTTGLTTLAMLDGTPPHLRVTWIAWDSPFRATDLRVGDRIIAINGAAIRCPLDPAERSKFIDRTVGGGSEPQGWTAAGLSAGARILLTVRRRSRPIGWTELTVSAPLAETTGYRDTNNRIVYGSGGPDTMSYDSFSDSWMNWYENRMLPALRRALDADQHTATFVTRVEWKQLAPQNDRVAYATDHYPGPWSRGLKADFDAAMIECEGAKVELPAGALDFRRRGEELAAETRSKAQSAWDAAKASVASETIPPFPAISPVRGDIRPVVGKYVVLPAIGNSGWVSEAGHGWFAAGSENDGWYFLDAESGAAQAMLRARQRFGRMVDPNVRAEFEFIARITNDSRLVVVGAHAHFGLVADAIAALVGSTMFVDLRSRNGDQVPFAGEDAYIDNDPQLPPNDAPPAAILSAMIDAIKLGDIALWRALHADWSIELNEQGRRVIYPHTSPPDDSNFEESKRSMNGRVLDARVAWTDNPQVVADGSRFPGALHIEECVAEIDHVGTFDGDVRVFADVTVRRHWRLQRVDGGPWRIASAQPI